MGDFLHYHRRRVVRVSTRPSGSPWYAEGQEDDQGLQVPRYHVTRRRDGPSARVREGDTIWVLSCLGTPWGSFPVALDFRLDVKAVQARPEGGFRYEAGPGSRWFPLFDASRAIQRLRTIDAEARRKPLVASRTRQVGQGLRCIRELADADELKGLEARLDEIGFEFISYRLADGTKRAFDKAMERVLAGAAVFWDRWSLPRRLAERREKLPDGPLESSIQEKIRQAKVVWVIRSPLYAEPGSYSAREYETALSSGSRNRVEEVPWRGESHDIGGSQASGRE